MSEKLKPYKSGLVGKKYRTDKYDFHIDYHVIQYTFVRNLTNLPVTRRLIDSRDEQMFFKYCNTFDDMDLFFDIYLEHKLSVLLHGENKVKEILNKHFND